MINEAEYFIINSFVNYIRNFGYFIFRFEVFNFSANSVIIYLKRDVVLNDSVGTYVHQGEDVFTEKSLKPRIFSDFGLLIFL